MEYHFDHEVTLVGRGAWEIKGRDGQTRRYANVSVTTGEGEPDTVSVAQDCDLGTLELFKPAVLSFRAYTNRDGKRKLQVTGIAQKSKLSQAA